jgi:hypothetical protein
MVTNQSKWSQLNHLKDKMRVANNQPKNHLQTEMSVQMPGSGVFPNKINYVDTQKDLEQTLSNFKRHLSQKYLNFQNDQIRGHSPDAPKQQVSKLWLTFQRRIDKFEDRYFVIGEVGKGTFGSVLKAFDVQRAQCMQNIKYMKKQEKLDAIRKLVEPLKDDPRHFVAIKKLFYDRRYE